ncbi:primosomal protein N' [Pacificimonas flava]|uniref:Replication restart protein PriA n=2 Tax=Pacificimonas TaxID=1960290 RepID=A0A219B461_9SPHN|nr:MULTISPECIES: primosomal protein N' [Pacificimonas]MBZ6377328.1 primosomal protein N' [Pacificimonas aurantium]OWV32964.1 primosomal protein N' [Pacificimonas flava]
MTRLRVLTLNAALGALDYAPREGVSAPPGTIVRVPLGPREIIGVVWEADLLPVKPVEDAKLRKINGAFDAPPLPERLRRLCEWTARYYYAPLSSVVRMAMPSPSALSEKTLTEYRLTGEVPRRLTPQRQAALDLLAGRQGVVRELAGWAGVSDAVIRGLVKAGVIEPVEAPADVVPPLPDPAFAPADLAPGQAAASARMTEAVTARRFEPFLLHGVTGSGKTETYLESVAAALESGGQALILLPEIALTEPLERRIEARFGVRPVSWHSDLRQSERRSAWRAIAKGEARLTVGARSALFLPYPNLRCIVVDEAHETSFKQEDGVLYHARDVAVMRGKLESVPVVLATATPPLEARVQAEKGTYSELTLPSRYGGASLPTIEAVDLREHVPPAQNFLSQPLVEAVGERIERGEQSLLFLNRRGYAPLTLCRHCGTRIECPNCSAWLVEHRLTRRLMCHHCGLAEPVPETCPECGEADTLVPCGPGVERIAEEAARRFPEARIALATSDTIGSPARARAFVDSVERGDVDILIGTQLITKGYHFPDLTLVGVVDADLALQGGDLRAGERTFQQIVQVAGRAGRGAKPGHVIIQTHQPDAPVIEALVRADAEGFYAAEVEARREAAMPPFGRLAALILSGPDESNVASAARMIGAAAPRSVDQFSVIGPAPAPLSLLRGRYRHRLLAHAARRVDLDEVLGRWLGNIDLPRDVRLTVDIDPYSFV